MSQKYIDLVKNYKIPYIVQPTLVNSTLIYQDINSDSNLRNIMVALFLKKSIKWMKKSENILSKLKSSKGYKIIYKYLRQYVNKHNVNWYDLKKDYSFVKKFLQHRLTHP